MRLFPWLPRAGRLLVGELVSSSILSVLWGLIPWGGGDAAAQELVVPVLSGPVELDGIVDERAWRDVPELSLTMFEPEFGGTITRATSIRVAHDGRFLYAAGVFEDDGPPRATGLVRDFDAEDDVFNLVLDTFHDRRTALWFAVNPAGALLDGAITDDAEGDAWNQVEYDSFWDAEAVLHERGWSAEIRIPFSSLRYQSVGGRAVMGIIIGRKIARVRERYTHPATPPGPGFAQFKPSNARTVVFEDLAVAPPRILTPYLTGGATSRPAASTPDWTTQRDAGADLKIGLTANLTADLTLNTDFAQTEVDDARVNLTRFDLLFPEKRKFFLERAGAFDFGDGLEHRLFHSRRIGLGEAGNPTRIHGGARVVGRVGAWDVGALSLGTETTAAGSAHTSALRVRRSVLGGGSWVGGVATTRAGAGGGLATASGLDADLKLGGRQYASVSLAASSAPGSAPRVGTAHARVLLQDRDEQGVSHWLEAVHVGAEYAPPVGFVLRRGSYVRAAVSHGRFGRGGRLQERVVTFDALAVRGTGGGLESAVGQLVARAVRAGGGDATMALALNHESLAEPFALPNAAAVPAGRYRFVDARLGVNTPAGLPAWAGVELQGGVFYDGWRFGAALRPGWSASRHLTLLADFETNVVRFPGRAEALDAILLRLRALGALNSRVSISGVLQYESTQGRAGGNVRFRYNVREGEDLYVVLSGGAGRADALDPREAWAWAHRTVLVKYSRALAW